MEYLFDMIIDKETCKNIDIIRDCEMYSETFDKYIFNWQQVALERLIPLFYICKQL